MDITPEEIEQAVRLGCRGLPEAVVRLNVVEALRELETKKLPEWLEKYLDKKRQNMPGLIKY